MNDARRNMDNRALPDGMLHAIECYCALAFQDIVKFGAAFMVVLAGAVNIHRVRPGGDALVPILATEEKMPPATGTAFPG